jgi:hypothetical protein
MVFSAEVAALTTVVSASERNTSFISLGVVSTKAATPPPMSRCRRFERTHLA